MRVRDGCSTSQVARRWFLCALLLFSASSAAAQGPGASCLGAVPTRPAAFGLLPKLSTVKITVGTAMDLAAAIGKIKSPTVLVVSSAGPITVDVPINITGQDMLVITSDATSYPTSWEDSPTTTAPPLELVCTGFTAFNIGSSNVVLHNMDISNCSDAGVLINAGGNAVATLTGRTLLSRCNIHDNFVGTAAFNFLAVANGYGPGVFANYTEVLVFNSTLTSNLNSAANGGALYTNGCDLRVVGSIFTSNNAVYGGGLYAQGSAVYLNHTLFEGNSATEGAAVGVADGVSTLIDRSQFVNNNASAGSGPSDGGTVAAYGFSAVPDAEGILPDCSLGPLSTVLISGSSFTKNTAYQGGGVLTYGVSLLLYTVTFTDNIAAGGGGAINVQVSYVEVARNSSFINNSAGLTGRGGACFSSVCALSFTDTTVAANTASVGGGIFASTGALTANGVELLNNRAGRSGGLSAVLVDQASFTGCTFRNNTSGAAGAGQLNNMADVAFDNCTFEDNQSSGTTGGLNMLLCNTTFTGCRFVNNFTPADGGAVLISSSNATFTNSIFANNTAGLYGAAIGGIDNSAKVQGCTFRNNTSYFEGGAIWVNGAGGAAATTNDTLAVSDSLFVGNNAYSTGGVIYAQNMTVSFVNVTALNNQAVDSGAVFFIQQCALVSVTEGLYQDNTCLGFGGVLTSTATPVIVNGTSFVNNTAVTAGFAQFVQGSASIVGSVITGNTAQAGGAISFLNTGNLTIQNTNMAYNQALLGGALAAHGVALSVIDSNFTGNSVNSSLAVVPFLTPQTTGDGGAIFLWDSTANITGSTFTGNTAAASAGGIYLRDTPTVMRNTSMIGNSAMLYGGALFASIINDNLPVAITTSKFAGNIASEGGAVALNSSLRSVLNPGSKLSVNMTGCSFTNNSATSEGGAFDCFGCSNLTTSQCSFSKNSAGNRGGALMCTTCFQLGLANTTILSNKAGSGGGLFLNDIREPASISGCSISYNQALGQTIAPAFVTLSPGIGGGIFLETSRAVNVASSSIVNNTAQNGGAIFVQGCNQTINGSTICPLVLRATTVQNNEALGGGGGAVYVPDNATLLVAQQPGAPATAQSAGAAANPCNAACLSIFERENFARIAGSYGAGVAGPPVTLTSNTDSNGNITLAAGLGGGLPFNANVSLYDSWGNVVVSGPSEFTTVVAQVDSNATCGIGVSSASTGPSFVQGQSKQSLNNGQGSFSLLVGACPGSAVNVSFKATAETTDLSDLTEIPAIQFPARLRECVVGQVAGTDGCSNCTHPFFNFDPASANCQYCPDNSNCTGAVVIPDDTYWHSHPRSAQLHYCPKPDACVRTPQQVAALQAIQTQLVNSNATTVDPATVAAYMSNMCATGYTGTLCGQCVVNSTHIYARQLLGVCGQCPEYKTAVAAFILARLFDLVCVIVLSAVAVYSVRSRQKELDEHETAIMTGVASKARAAGKFNQVQLLDLATKGSATLRHQGSAAASKRSKGVSKDAMFSQISTPDNVLPAPAPHVPLGNPAALAENDEIDTFHANPVEEYQTPLSMEFRYRPVVEMLRDFLQLLGILRNTAAQQYLSEATHAALSVFSFTPQNSMTWVSVECLLPNSIDADQRTFVRILAQTLLPFGYLALMTLLLLPYIMWSRKKAEQGVKAAPAVLYLKLTLLTTIVYFYPSMVNGTLTLLSCTTLDSAPRFLGEVVEARGRLWVEDYNITCYAGEHLLVLLALGIPVLLLIIIGYPLGLLVFLIINKRRHGLADPRFWTRYGLLYEEYKAKRFYWAAVMPLRQLLLLVVAAAFSTSSAPAQILAATTTVFALFLVQLGMWPYHTRRFNAMQTIVLSTLIWTMYCIYGLATIATTERGQGTLQVLLLLANGACALWCLHSILVGLLAELLVFIDEDPNGKFKFKYIGVALHKVMSDTRSKLKAGRMGGPPEETRDGPKLPAFEERKDVASVPLDAPQSRDQYPAIRPL